MAKHQQGRPAPAGVKPAGSAAPKGGVHKAQQQNKGPHSKGHGAGKQQDSAAAAGVQKARDRIRLLKHLLNKPDLSDAARAAAQRELDQLHAAQQEAKRVERERKLAIRYHKVRFFERVKIERKIAHAQKALAQQGAEAPKRAELEAELQQLQQDLLYVRHFPPGEKYVSLLKQADGPEAQAHLEAERARLRALVASQLEAKRRAEADLAALTQADEGRALQHKQQQQQPGGGKGALPAAAPKPGPTKRGGAAAAAGGKQAPPPPADQRVEEEQAVEEDDFFLSGDGDDDDEGAGGKPAVPQVPAGGKGRAAALTASAWAKPAPGEEEDDDEEDAEEEASEEPQGAQRPQQQEQRRRSRSAPSEEAGPDGPAPPPAQKKQRKDGQGSGRQAGQHDGKAQPRRRSRASKKKPRP